MPHTVPEGQLVLRHCRRTLSWGSQFASASPRVPPGSTSLRRAFKATDWARLLTATPVGTSPTRETSRRTQCPVILDRRNHETRRNAAGKAIFFDETLDGLGANGRACSTCHVAQDGFQLTPDRASARLLALQQARVTRSNGR